MAEYQNSAHSTADLSVGIRIAVRVGNAVVDRKISGGLGMIVFERFERVRKLTPTDGVIMGMFGASAAHLTAAQYHTNHRVKVSHCL